MPHRLRLATAILLITLGTAIPLALLANYLLHHNITALSPGSDMQFETGNLQIITKDGKIHKFRVEIASTPAQLSRGLMYRREMAGDAGMLFLFPEEKIITMWMKNTYIPLDMVFIRKDGTVSRIEEHTTPASLHVISSGVPVVSVLELNAGTSNRLGIKEGDKIIRE